MLRSLMTAVTGVRAHQTMLDVTGNNIANANTTGFKKDNTIFADLMYQANKYASASTGNRGGINPAQVGLGVSVAAIETIHTQGSSSYTGNPSDMMIQDKGFFVYSDGNSQLFSRSGACVLDGNSDMVQAGTGYKLQGYKMEETPLDGYQQAAELSTVNIPIGQKIDAHATTVVDYQCNLNSETNAYLSYGFADIPYNAVAGWKGNENGTAIVKMDGADYEFSFNTKGLDVPASDLQTGESGYNAEGTGAFEYLHVDIANGGVTTRVGFDLVGIDNGLPVLRLPTISYDSDAVTYTYPTTGTGELTFVGILDDKYNLYDAVPTSTLGSTITETDQNILNSYTPVYQFPGSTPPNYFTVKYDDS
ncbi:MAG: flagellar hook-basal body complex protein, partial [Synergistaceae bacterium]|nr:flagellar hook-basal body complex protein [Synergistaceae bacterium]